MNLIPRPTDFTSPLRSTAVTARVGRWLGISFAVAFVTGLVSHAAQEPDSWFVLPTNPVWLYQVNQGLHTLSGIAAIPLLLVKLWSVFPKLFARPTWEMRAQAREGFERLSIAVLVGGSLFLLASGLANMAQWYPWDFRFRATHHALAWVTIGALIVHVAMKLPLIREGLSTPLKQDPDDVKQAPISRRTLLHSTWAASAIAVLATAGGTVPWLRNVSVLAVRSGEGPGGIPINKTARAAGVTASALSGEFALTVRYGTKQVTLSRTQLAALTQHTYDLPIACVEGWSATGRWTGVRVRDLLDLVGAPPGRQVQVRSLQEQGPFRATVLPGEYADDPKTLLALELAGEPLALDHGFPCRLIAANRPGVLQTKWVNELEVLA